MSADPRLDAVYLLPTVVAIVRESKSRIMGQVVVPFLRSSGDLCDPNVVAALAFVQELDSRSFSSTDTDAASADSLCISIHAMTNQFCAVASMRPFARGRRSAMPSPPPFETIPELTI